MGLVVALGAGAVMAGAVGATVSTLKGVVVDGRLVPPVVVAVATTVCAPSISAVLRSQLQAPVGEAVAVHAGVELPSMKTRTSAPGLAVPVTVGVESFVAWPEEGAEMTGGPGGVPVATLKFRTGVARLVLPAASRASAVRVCAPAESGPAITQL